MPNANTDYVFAVIGEELGLIGCVAVLALFGLFAYTGMRIARRSADPFVRLVAGAATVWLCGQAVINIGYVTGLLPVTGIPLPFISAGGTSLLATFFVLGMLVSFARHEPAAVDGGPQVAAASAAAAGSSAGLRIPVPRRYRAAQAPPRSASAASPAERATARRARLPRDRCRTRSPGPSRAAGARARGLGRCARPAPTDGVDDRHPDERRRSR